MVYSFKVIYSIIKQDCLILVTSVGEHVLTCLKTILKLVLTQLPNPPGHEHSTGCRITNATNTKT